jgi:hypothetical protein
VLRFTVELRGVDKLRAKWGDLLTQIGGRFAEAAMEAAEEGAAAARRNHLYENRTSDLEESTQAVRGRTTRRGGTALVVARMFYASFVDRNERYGGFMKMARLVADQELRKRLRQILAAVRTSSRR